MARQKTSAENARFWSVQLRRFVNCVAVLTIIILIALIAVALIRPDLAPELDNNIEFVQLSGLARFTLLASTFVYVAMFLLPLWYLQRLLGLWSSGLLLTAPAARDMKRTGVTLLVATIIEHVYVPLSDFALNLLQGQIVMEVEFDFQAMGFIAGGILYIAGLVMEEAARLAEEAELVI